MAGWAGGAPGEASMAIPFGHKCGKCADLVERLTDSWIFTQSYISPKDLRIYLEKMKFN